MSTQYPDWMYQILNRPVPSNQGDAMYEKLMNEKQLAEYLNVSPRTVQTWRLQGKGPVWTKAGRHVRYLMSDVQEYLQRRRRQ